METSLWDDGYVRSPIHCLFSWAKWLFERRLTFWILSKQHRFVWFWWGTFSTHDFYTWYIIFPISLSRSNWNMVREFFRRKVPIVFSYTYLELCEWNVLLFNSSYLSWSCNPTLVSYVWCLYPCMVGVTCMATLEIWLHLAVAWPV